jgi:peptidoglycan/xylan/chitin deacetylase (PgdA/CDA1 family)
VQSRTINLTFHGVGPIERPLEPGEDLFWLDEDEFEAALDSVAGRGDVRITFDDGNVSDLHHALPQLSRRGLSATFFVVAGRLGSPGFLDERDVRELAEAGMTIGCHGMRHRSWRHLDEDALREELIGAKVLLEDVADRPVTEAACPFGAYDRRVLTSLRRHGYRRVFTSDTGIARSGDWLQTRNSVRPGQGPDVIQRVLETESSTPNLVCRRVKRTVKQWR